MNETRTLAVGIHDNHGLTLWHDWQALVGQIPELQDEWRYERDDTRNLRAGPGECLTRCVGTACLRVLLGGDGRYTPLAELDPRPKASPAGMGRIRTSVSPPRTDSLFAALAAEEEAVSALGQPVPPARRGRSRSLEA